MDIHSMQILESLNFLQILTLLLVALLFGKDTMLPWIGEKFFGIERSKEKDQSRSGSSIRLERKMDELQLHFNHETTELLTSIKENTATTARKLDEWERFGTPPSRPK